MCMHRCAYNPPSLSCHRAGLVKETLTDADTFPIGIRSEGLVKVDIVAVLLSSHDVLGEGIVVFN